MNWLRSMLHNFAGIPFEPLQAAPVRVLAVMAKDSDAQDLSRIAGRANWHLEFASGYEAAAALVKRQEYSVILYDRDLTITADWRDTLAKLVATAPGSYVILASPVNDDQLWQEVIRRGGYDVLTKPFQQERVTRSINYASLMKSRLYAPHTESIPGFPSD